MGFFDPQNRFRTKRSERVYALYEIGYTAVDFTAAALFVIGSVLFLGEATVRLGTWLFVVGSLCFAAKPTIRLVREVHLLRIGRVDLVAGRAGD